MEKNKWYDKLLDGVQGNDDFESLIIFEKNFYAVKQVAQRGDKEKILEAARPFLENLLKRQLFTLVRGHRFTYRRFCSFDSAPLEIDINKVVIDYWYLNSPKAISNFFKRIWLSKIQLQLLDDFDNRRHIC